MPAGEPLANRAEIDELLDSLPRRGLRTHRTHSNLAWRYGFEPLGYRAVAVDAGRPSRGLLIFRLRRRGPALEAAVCEELVPGGEARLTRRLVGAVLAATGADYAIRLGAHRPRAGFVPLPRQGPTLLRRDLCGGAPRDRASWRLGLGDIELF
jgi:hypothetical protein